MISRRTRRSLVRGGRSLAVLGTAAALTAALMQSAASGAFTGGTEDPGNSLSAAADFCSASGSVQATPVADTAVDEGNPSTNYHTNASIGAISDSGDNARSLLRFTLPLRPTGCVLVSATLSLRLSSGTSGGTIDVHRAATAWTASAVTWTTMPGFTGTPVGIASTSSAGTVQQWTVTDHVTNLYAGPDHGFLLKDRNEDVGDRSQIYDSMDAATASYRPRLTIIWG